LPFVPLFLNAGNFFTYFSFLNNYIVIIKLIRLWHVILYFRKIFPEGATIIYDGEDFLCETCDSASPKKQPSIEQEVEQIRPGPPSYEHHTQIKTPQIEPATPPSYEHHAQIKTPQRESVTLAPDETANSKTFDNIL
jgi:hypothetical protein